MCIITKTRSSIDTFTETYYTGPNISLITSTSKYLFVSSFEAHDTIQGGSQRHQLVLPYDKTACCIVHA